MLCVIPCAGLGTRLRPLTLVVPKELLPYGDRPLIQHLIEEVQKAGITRIVIVLRPEKEIIRQHLEAAGIECFYAVQQEPRGLADALLAAAPLVGDEPFLMALPDQQMPGASSQLVAHYSGQVSLSSMVELSDWEAELFPGAAGFELEGEGPLYTVRGLQPGGRLRGFGRTIFGPGFQRSIPPDTRDGDFGDIFKRSLSSGVHQAVQLHGQPADLGTMKAYLHYQKSAPLQERPR